MKVLFIVLYTECTAMGGPLKWQNHHLKFYIFIIQEYFAHYLLGSHPEKKIFAQEIT